MVDTSKTLVWPDFHEPDDPGVSGVQ